MNKEIKRILLIPFVIIGIPFFIILNYIGKYIIKWYEGGITFKRVLILWFSVLGIMIIYLTKNLI